MNSIATILISTLLLCGNARANDIEEFKGGRIIGRGIMDRKTGESVAIACAGKADVAQPELRSCDELRHVIFIKDNIAYFTGPTFKVVSEGEVTDQQIKATLKEVRANFKKLKKENSIFIKQSGLTVLVGVGAAAVGALTLGSAGFALGVAVPILLADPSTTLSSSSAITQVFLDQNGWNWSSEPKVVSRRRYDQYLNFLDGARFNMKRLHYGEPRK